jgi:catechol 2,3-dioxygenase-like lactoylglutathione lyase family enzyme
MANAVKTGAIKLGEVGHFGLAVRNVEASAAFWTQNFNLKEIFRGDEAIGLSNDAVTIVLRCGTPDPRVIGHMSFHLKDMEALRAALTVLKSNGVSVEDPDDEIGPEAPGSSNMGLWFRCLDGYRWELSVLNGAKEE